MALARRTRMVSIRLSNDEFERLKGRCELVGARSLSDIAREAMLLLLESEGRPISDRHHLSNGHHEPSTLHRVESLEDRLQTLQHDVFRLNLLVENLCKSN